MISMQKKKSVLKKKFSGKSYDKMKKFGPFLHNPQPKPKKKISRKIP